MSKSLINLGTTPNDRTGDTLRDAGSKVNSNVNELYTALGNGTQLQVAVSGATNGQVLKFNGTAFVPSTDLNTDAVASVNTKTGVVVLGSDDIAEGTTNQYFTTARARSSISASGALGYNSTTGALTFTQGDSDTVAEGTNNLYYTAGRFAFTLSQKTTDDLAQGLTNKYFSNSLVRETISAGGDLSYSSSTGVMSYTTPNPVVTNQFYVDPARVDTYTATGSIFKPFKLVGDALSYINSAISAGSLTPGETNPIFIILRGNTTEDITLSTGHVFLVGDYGSIHTPIYFNGSITVNGTNSTTGAIDANHFAIVGLTIVGDPQKAGIYFTGSNAQRLMLQSVWLTARGNQTGTTAFTDAGGYGIYADNTGVRAADGKHSVVHGSDIKISHSGTGDVYCIRVSGGSTADFSNVETSGATQVGAVSSGSLLSFTNSTLDANGEVCIEAYGTGILTATNCSISNSRTGTESYGVWLHGTGSTAVIGQCYFNIADTSQAGSRAIKGVAGTVFIGANNLFAKNSTLTGDTNKKIDTAVTVVPLTSSFTTV